MHPQFLLCCIMLAELANMQTSAGAITATEGGTGSAITSGDIIRQLRGIKKNKVGWVAVSLLEQFSHTKLVRVAWPPGTHGPPQPCLSRDRLFDVMPPCTASLLYHLSFALPFCRMWQLWCCALIRPAAMPWPAI